MPKILNPSEKNLRNIYTLDTKCILIWNSECLCGKISPNRLKYFPRYISTIIAQKVVQDSMSEKKEKPTSFGNRSLQRRILSHPNND